MRKILADERGRMNVLLLDYDSVDDAAHALTRLPLVANQTGVRVQAISYEYSSSKRGVHVVVFLKDFLPAFQVVLLQSLCGSDWRRETFNQFRVRNLARARAFWRKRWNVFYCEKWRAPE